MWSNQEIIFAQKATAIVKAAGMDPRLIDLEQFRMLAPIIFARAFCAIYKENLFDLDTDNTKEEVILISQLVIDGLVAKTRNPALSMITGFDVYQRNHRAIGILVGILFDEGQRLWLEKRGSFSEKTIHTGNSSRRSQSPSKAPEVETNSPREIRKLLNKIDNLEGQIRKPKPKAEEVHSKFQTNKTDNSDPTTSEGNDIDKDSVNDRTSSPSTSPKSKKRPMSASGLSSSYVKSSGQRSRPSSAGAMRTVQQLKRKQNDFSNLPMPPTEPPRSPRSQNKKNDDIQYTYDMKSGRRIPLKSTNDIYNQQHIVTTLDQLNQNKQAVANSVHPPKINLPLRPEYPGKRIERSVEEWLKKVQEMNKYAADPHYHSPILERDVANLPQSGVTPGSGGSIIVYHPIYATLEEHDLILTIEHCHNCANHNVSLRHDPKEYQEKSMKYIKQLASSIFEEQYCVRLGIGVIPADLSHSHHSRIGAFEIQIAYKSPISRETEIDLLYSKLQTRRWPSKSVVDKRLETFFSKHQIPRVKSSALHSDDYDMTQVTDRSGHSYSYPRGKCEYEVLSIAQASWAFQFHPVNDWNEFIYDFRSLIPKDTRFAKVPPSTSSKVIPTLEISSRITSHQVNNNNQNDNARSLNSPTSGRSKSSQLSVPSNDSSRGGKDEQSTPPLLFSIGQKILVRNVPYSVDCIEPHPITGVIKQLPLQPITHAHLIVTPRELSHRKYKVQLLYHSSDIEVAEGDISAVVGEIASDHPGSTQIPIGHTLPLPLELEALLLLLTREGADYLWQFPTEGDQINVITREIEYSRKTVYQTIRSILWQLKSLLWKKEQTAFSTIREVVTFHPRTNETVDLHQVYSDRVITWIFFSSRNESMNQKDYVSSSFLINMPQQVLSSDMVPNPTQEPQQPTGPITLSSQEEKERENNVYSTMDEKIASARAEEGNLSQSHQNATSNDSPVTADTAHHLNSEIEGETVKQEIVEEVKESNTNLSTNITISSSFAANQLPSIDPDPKSSSPSGNPSLPLSENNSNEKSGKIEVSAVTLSSPLLIEPMNNTNSGVDYESKDIIISSIILEGGVLSHEFYDSIFVSFIFETFRKEAKVCLAREKGSKRRSFNVSWDEIPITSFAFNENAKNGEKSAVNLILAISDLALSSAQPTVPTLQNSEIGKSSNTCQIPLHEFYKDSFEIKCEVTLPNFHPPPAVTPTPSTPATANANNSTANVNPGRVEITINGHAHEAKETRRSRILSMKPVELIKLKFEPLPVDDEYSSDENEESTEDQVATKKIQSTHLVNKDNIPIHRKTVIAHPPQHTIIEGDEEREDEDPRSLSSPPKVDRLDEHQYESSFEQPEQEEDLQNNLFPKASMFNLLTADN